MRHCLLNKQHPAFLAAVSAVCCCRQAYQQPLGVTDSSGIAWTATTTKEASYLRDGACCWPCVHDPQRCDTCRQLLLQTADCSVAVVLWWLRCAVLVNVTHARSAPAASLRMRVLSQTLVLFSGARHRSGQWTVLCCAAWWCWCCRRAGVCAALMPACWPCAGLCCQATAVCIPFMRGLWLACLSGGRAVPCVQRRLVCASCGLMPFVGCSVAAGLWCAYTIKAQTAAGSQSPPGLVQWCVAVTAPVLICAVVACVVEPLCGGHPKPVCGNAYGRQAARVGHESRQQQQQRWYWYCPAAAVLVDSCILHTWIYSTVDTQRAAACCSQ